MRGGICIWRAFGFNDPQMSEQIEARLTALREKAKAYGKAKAQESYLDEFKKSKLAILMKDAEKAGYTSAAAQEREARASEEWGVFLTGLKEATEQAESLRWALQIDMAAIEIWRTQQSTKRAEMAAYK